MIYKNTIHNSEFLAYTALFYPLIPNVGLYVADCFYSLGVQANPGV